jgi:hypothetical protein
MPLKHGSQSFSVFLSFCGMNGSSGRIMKWSINLRSFPLPPVDALGLKELKDKQTYFLKFLVLIVAPAYRQSTGRQVRARRTTLLTKIWSQSSQRITKGHKTIVNGHSVNFLSSITSCTGTSFLQCENFYGRQGFIRLQRQ